MGSDKMFADLPFLKNCLHAPARGTRPVSGSCSSLSNLSDTSVSVSSSDASDTPSPPPTSPILKRLKDAIAPDTVASIEFDKIDGSGATSLSFTTSGGRKCFAKMALPWEDLKHPEELRAEVRQAPLAAQRGLAPEVIFVDHDRGTLITEHCGTSATVMPDGAEPRRLAASLNLLRALHDSEPELVMPARALDADEVLAGWDARRFHHSHVHLLPLSRTVIEECVDRLSKMPFVPRPCHQEAHPRNIVFSKHGGGKALLVDWGTFKYADTMEELAYHLWHISYGIKDVDELTLELYGGLTPDERTRLLLHLALIEAQRGVESKCPHLLRERLEEDKKWLGLQ